MKAETVRRVSLALTGASSLRRGEFVVKSVLKLLRRSMTINQVDLKSRYTKGSTIFSYTREEKMVYDGIREEMIVYDGIPEETMGLIG